MAWLLGLLAFSAAWLSGADLISRQVTLESFEEAVTSSFVVLVDFYAPWCGYCTTLEGQLKVTAAQLDKEGVDVRIVTVDATQERELAAREGVSGYPSLLIYRNGVLSSVYHGERKHRALTDHLREKAGPLAQFIDGKDSYFAYTKVALYYLSLSIILSDQGPGTYLSYHFSLSLSPSLSLPLSLSLSLSLLIDHHHNVLALTSLFLLSLSCVVRRPHPRPTPPPSPLPTQHPSPSLVVRH